MPKLEARPLPLAPARGAWAVIDRDRAIAGRECDLLFRLPLAEGEGPALPADLEAALPLLLHEFDAHPRLRALLQPEHWQGAIGSAARPDRTPRAILLRLLPQLLSYRLLEGKGQRELCFRGARPDGLHVLARVLETDYRFRLEDLSHFATHGELVGAAAHVSGLQGRLDPEGIIYCPAVDPPYPFKFALAAPTRRPTREVYLELLRVLLRRTEPDELFRARTFRELARGFSKFGPAAATPAFQEVELRTWRLLRHLAARLRVKAGRLTDAEDPTQARLFLGELRDVHDVLNDLVHLPSRLAAFFRTHFDLELATLSERALTELDGLAARVDCELGDEERTVDTVAALVSEFRRLGNASPLETLIEKERELRAAYGDVDLPPLETGWARTYSAKIFTGASTYDARRYGDEEEPGSGEELSEEELELDMDLRFGFGGE